MHKTHPTLATASKREHEAFDLRCQGYVWQEIAEQIGYTSHSGAYRAYWRYVKKMAADPKAQELRHVQLGRLQTLLYAVLLKAVKGDLDCLDRALRIIQEISKLMGLYKPQQAKVDIELTDKRIEVEGLTIDALAELADAAETIQQLDPGDVAFLERFGWDAPQPRSPMADGLSGGDGYEPTAD